MLCGVDDAGRGPVIGPMVISGVCISDENKFNNLGLKDSKLLSHKKRKELFSKIVSTADSYKIIVIPSDLIDKHVLSRDSNLNKLEAMKFAEAVNYLKPSKVIIDCPSNNVKEYSRTLRGFLKFDVKLKCEHKADFKYPVVSAASILAKVVRDKEIDKLKKKYGNIGSGYPSDPLTKRFLQLNWKKYPEIFRKSWATYKNVAESKEQKRLGEF